MLRNTLLGAAVALLTCLSTTVAHADAGDSESVSAGPPVVSIGDTLSGSIDSTNDRDDYTVMIPAGQTLYLQSTAASSGSQLAWKICDSFGRVIGKQLNNFNNDIGPIRLLGGPYTITVLSRAGGSSTYEFLISDADPQSSVLTTGTPVVGEILNPGGQVDYAFTATSSQQIYIDVTATSSAGSGKFSLTDALGNVVASTPSSLIDLGPISLIGGDYTLSVLSDAGGTTSYEFTVSNVTDEQSTTTIGSTITGEISVAGQIDRYDFTATPGQRIGLEFIASSFSSALNYLLVDSYGREIIPRTTSLNSIGAYALLGGDYTLSILAEGANTATYEFTLVEVIDGSTPTTLGSAIAAEISHPGEQDTYTFTAAAGQSIYLETVTTSNAGGLNWRLEDSFGRTLVQTTSLNDYGRVELMGGDYSVSVVSENGGTGTYTINVHSVTDVSAGTAIGASESDALTTPGQRLSYAFTAPVGQRVTFDAITPASSGSINWVLEDVHGRAIFGPTPSFTDQNSVALMGGDYVLSIYAENVTTGPIEFTLIDDGVTTFTASGTPIAFDTPVASDISVASEVDNYTFVASGGQELYFDLISGGSGTRWDLLDPVGQAIFTNISATSATSGDRGPFVLAAGTYQLSVYATGTSTPSYEIAVRDVVDSTFTGALDTPTNGALSSIGSTHLYDFTIGTDTIAYFDLISGVNILDWSLTDEYGERLFLTSTSSTTSSDRGPYRLQAGSYQLLFDADNHQLAAYEFQVTTVTNPTIAIAVASPVVDMLTAPGETSSYVVTAAEGQRLFFDLQQIASGLRWSCFDSVGEPLFTNVSATSTISGDRGPYTLKAGDYTVAVTHQNDDESSFGFEVVDSQDTQQVVSLGDLLTGSIADLGAVHEYVFDIVGGPRRLFIDNQIAVVGLNATLLNGSGSTITSFNMNTVGTDYGPVLLTDGSYTVLIRRNSGSGGPYSVQLSEPTHTETVIGLEDVVAFDITSPGSKQDFLFDVPAGQQVIFSLLDSQTFVRWTLEDAVGESGGLFNYQTAYTPVASNRGPFLLAAGEYTLKIQTESGVVAGGSFAVMFGGVPDPIVVESDWSRTESHIFDAAQSARYNSTDDAVYVASRTPAADIYCLHASGIPLLLENTAQIAGIAVTESGEVFFSIDGSGYIDKIGHAGLWVTAFGGGGRDPAGMAVTPSTYAGPLAIADMLVVADPGIDGPDGIWLVDVVTPNTSIELVGDASALEHAVDVAISDQHLFIADAGDGATGHLWRLDPGDTLVNLGATGLVPVGIAIDPLTDDLLVVDRLGQRVVRFDPDTGTQTDVITGLRVDPNNGWASIDITPDGRNIYVSATDKIHVFTRCGTSGVDCNGNGVDDDCDIALSTSGDCNNNGIPDECDIANGTSTDLNFDGVPDECLPCSLIDLVFIMDTSGSMTGEAAALCELLPNIVDSLGAAGVTVNPETLAISDNPGGVYSCLSGNVRDIYGGGVAVDCGAFLTAGTEDWGRATQAIAELYAWTPGAVRLIVPISDEGPWCGDGISAEDFLSIDNAIFAAIDNNVIVSPITGDGSSATVIDLATELALATGGTVFSSETSTVDEISAAVQSLVLSSCPCGVAINDIAPTSGSTLPAGTQVTLTGRAVSIDPARPVIAVLVNGDPADSLDLTGRFFETVVVGEGINSYTIEIVQTCDVSTTTVTLIGATSVDPLPLEFTDISLAMTTDYSGTTFSQTTSALQVIVEGCNTSAFDLAGPVRMVVTGFSDPSLSVANPAGVTDSGDPYLEFLSTGDILGSGECTPEATLVIDNPNRVPVFFDVLWLAAENRPPLFESAPVVTAAADVTYTYDANASDPDGDSVSFSLSTGPAGMTVDSLTGVTLWSPTLTDIGAHTVRIAADDGRGATATQVYTLQVVASIANQAPYFSSAPITQIAVGTSYVYAATGVDLDGDPLAFTKLDGPADLTVSPTGLVEWPFTLPGSYSVHIRAEDGNGGVAEQQYLLTVGAIAINPHAPEIFGTPATSAVVDQLYLYQPATHDADPGDTVTHTLAVSPTGMAVDAVNGRVTWIPEAGQEGVHSVTLVANDGNGGISSQSWTVEVFGSLLNQPPVVQTVPTFFAEEGQLYEYAVAAFDPNLEPVTYELVSPPAGMVIDPVTGLLSWTPTTAGDYVVAIRALDPSLAFGSQVYTLTVIPPNTAPSITSTPVTDAILGGTYQYLIEANDPDGQSLGFSLDDGPNGMSVSGTGQVNWIPGLTQLGTHAVTVRASDGFGGSVTQSYDVTVVEDTSPPNVAIDVGASLTIPLGQSILITVGATDDVAVATRTLSIDGVEVTLDTLNTTVFTAAAAGSYELFATALDPSGNLGTATATLNVLAPDAELPVVNLISPSPDDSLTSFTDIVVDISDNNPTGLTWTVSYRPALSDSYTVLTTGADEVVATAVATFDPTLLPNGEYQVRVLAEDLTGNTGGIEFRVFVDGQLKMGQYATSFVDLIVPVAGFPIAITRQYSTLDVDTVGDFGRGWRLGFAGGVYDTAAEIDHPIELVDNLNDEPFTNATRVYVTLPDGERVGFTFSPTAASVPFISFAAFTPDEGVEATLEAIPRFGAGAVMFTGVGYSEFVFPYNPEVYKLTTKEGAIYTIHEEHGLQKIEDIFGNTINVTKTGLISSSGISVDFQRDPEGRITKVIEPEPQGGGRQAEMNYLYDTDGNLVQFIDQEGGITTYEYGERDFPNHMTGIEDPNGDPVSLHVFDDNGRIVAMCSAFGDLVTLDGCATFEYATAGTGGITVEIETSQTLYDGNANRVDVFYDIEGNMVVERRWVDGVTFLDTVSTYENGRLITETDPLGHTHTNTYDARGNLTSRSNPSGETWTFTYDDRDNRTSICDPQGNCETTEYDEFDRALSRTDQLGNQELYGYFADGSLSAYQDQNGNLWTFEYTGGGTALEQVNHPDGTTDHFTRNVTGDVTQNIDRAGRVRTFEFDALHRVIQETWDSVPPEVFTYEYDAAGNLTVATSSTSDLTVERWPTGFTKRVTAASVAGSTAYSMSYAREDAGELVSGYDGGGNLTHVFDSFGGMTQYSYDNLDRLTGISQTSTDPTILGGVPQPVADKSLAFEYDDASLIQAIRRFDDFAGTASVVDTLYTYDCGACPNRIATLDHRRVSDDTSLHALSFSRNATGDITEIVDFEGTHTIAVDGSRRILGVTRPASSPQIDEFYSYDQVGNRLSSQASSSYSYSYQTPSGSGNRLEQDDNYAYDYDVLGNLATRTDLGDLSYTEYTYDYRNRLTLVRLFDSSDVEQWVASYTYDAFDRRIRSDEDGVVRQYVYDSENAVVVLDGVGNVVKRRLATGAIDDVFGYEEGGSTYWYLKDPTQNVRDIVDATGTVQRHYIYDTFGVVVGGTGSLDDDVRFQSREFSDLTGLGYFRARYYDPTLGRFLSEDPRNPYRYDFGVNNPFVFRDPTGQVSAIEWACEVVHAISNVNSVLSVVKPLATLYATVTAAVVTKQSPAGGGGAAARRYRDEIIAATLNNIVDEVAGDGLFGCAVKAFNMATGGPFSSGHD